jgi:hypothetical protein
LNFELEVLPRMVQEVDFEHIEVRPDVAIEETWGLPKIR